MTSPGANLDAIAEALATFEARHAAIERGHYGKSSTTAMNAGFVSAGASLKTLRAAVDKALADRAAWLQGPFRPVPRNAAEQRAPYMAPEARDAFPVVARYADQVVEHSITSTGSSGAVSALVTCPRCLRKDADRADVEQSGCCGDCGHAGYATKSPASDVAAQPTAASPHPGANSGPVAASDAGAVLAQPEAE